jgi:hypothetical protein
LKSSVRILMLDFVAQRTASPDDDEGAAAGDTECCEPTSSRRRRGRGGRGYRALRTHVFPTTTRRARRQGIQTTRELAVKLLITL